MAKLDKTLLENLRSFSSATIFNAVVETMGATQGGRELEDKGGQPTCNTNHHLKYLTQNPLHQYFVIPLPLYE